MLSDDVRQSLRSLRRAPGLSATIILTAALGIGAGTSLFSVVKAVLLNPLPYPKAQQLVWVASLSERAETRTSLADFDDWRARSHSFSSLAAYSEANLLIGGGSEPQQITGAMVSEQFFQALGVPPALGRDFTAAEHKARAPFAGVVLSHGLWQRAYGSDPHIVGRGITVLGMPSKVIGVMPRGFAYPAGADLWFSARAVGEGAGRTAHNYWVVGRLRAGVSATAARDELSAIARQLRQRFSGPYQTSDATAVPLADHFTGSVRTPLILLFAAVGLLLAIVCVNIANLLLVRLSARSGELAVRAALGAGASRLFRHLLIESLALALAGGALGLLFAAWSIDLLPAILPASIPRAAEVTVDSGVLAFALGATLLAGILFGTLPSWLASRASIHEVLKGMSRANTSSRRSLRVQSLLVVSEVALSVLLLAGAGLLLTSFARLRAVDPGFHADSVLTARVSWPVSEAPRLRVRYRDLLDRVRAIPGASSAGLMRELPLDPVQRRGAVRIEGRPDLPAAEADYVIASPGAMETLRVPLVRGRRFDATDTAESLPVTIVNQEMARRFWPDRDAIGQRLWFTGFEGRPHWLTVIGIAGDMRQTALTDPVREQAWVCYSQLQSPAYLISGTLVVHSPLDAAALSSAIRNAAHEVSAGAAVTFRPMDALLTAATARQRFQLQVLGSFALLALVLAAIGIYGVLSYTVASNRAAIGIRMALGARPVDVVRLFVTRAFLLVALGAALGIGACLAAGELLRTVVFGVAPGDPWILAAAAVIMTIAALAAAAIPARRAARIDPLSTLRSS